MNLKQILNALDHASLEIAAADGRRVLREEANSLRAHAQRSERAAALREQFAGLQDDKSNQGSAQRASIQQELDRIGTVDLAARIVEAKKTLDLWTA